MHIFLVVFCHLQVAFLSLQTHSLNLLWHDTIAEDRYPNDISEIIYV